MLKTMTVRATIAAILAGLSMSAHAIADSPKRVDIPAGELRQALLQVSEQFGTDLVYSPEQIQGIQTRGAHGQLTTEQAVTKLLEGTPLELRTDPSGAMLITPPAAAKDAPQPSSSAGERSKSFWSRLRLAQSDTPSTSQVDTTNPSPSKGEGQGEDERPAQPQKRAELEEIVVTGIPEILVKGSRILNMDIQRSEDDVQPYVIFDKEAIAQSGVSTVEQFLQTRLTMSTNAGSSSQSVNERSILGATSSINLRGLGSNQTLILIDGHRVSGAVVTGTPQQPDINGIPLSAIERIEVLPSTASGIYGGSATGGVINIVLRRDYSGLTGRIAYGGAFDGGSAARQAEVSGGFSLEGGRTSILLSASYRNANDLSVDERDFAERSRALILSNSPTYFPALLNAPIGATPNIRSNAPLVNGVRPSLTLKPQYGGASLGSPITFVPVGYAGVASDNGAGLIANAGNYNLDVSDTAQLGSGGRSPLLGNPEAKSANLTVRREFTPRIQSFLELGASSNYLIAPSSGLTGTFTLPVSNPNNPFAQAVSVTLPMDGTDGWLVSENTQLRAIGGVIVSLGAGWQAEADHSWSRARFSTSFQGGITAAGSTAIRTGSVNVLRDLDAFPVDFASFVGAPTTISPGHAETHDTTVRFAGPTIAAWGGPVSVAVLLEHRREKFSESVLINPVPGFDITSRALYPSTSQSIDSVYLETRIPLVSAKNALPGVSLLEVQVAGRRDEYTVHGSGAVALDAQLVPLVPVSRFTDSISSTNPTFGLRYAPISDLVFRGSYSKGFLPPAVDQLSPGAPVNYDAASAASLGLSDPQRGNEPLGAFTQTSGGNPELNPERSTSVSAGFIFTPRFLNELRFSTDWTRIRKIDNIATLAFNQATINQEPNVPGLITRAPAAAGDPYGVGPITAVSSSLINVARAEFEAYDFALDYSLPSTNLGSWKFALAATRLMHVKTQTSLTSPEIENLGVAGALLNIGNTGGGLKWKANALVSWQYRDWTVGWASRYFDSYWLNLNHTVEPLQGSATIPSQIYHDAFVKWRAPSGLGVSILADTEVQLNVQNVFNRSPPIDVIGPSGRNASGYSAWGDPRLAFYQLSIQKSF